MPEDTPPGRVGRFEIRREIGRGTMGVVFEAHDPTLHRKVALKVIRLAFATNAKERDDFERRFLTEARAAAGLSHPGIVVVHEAGRDALSGMLYLALEHLEGRALSDLLAEKGRLPEEESLRLTAQVARALDYAHQKGVVHRDVKPANIMALPGGQAKILDFGLAKVEAGHEQTAAGQFLGTPLFVSPEQALGLPVDGRSDLFSLGAILYTLLAGRRPFEGESLARILNRVAHQPPPPLREANFTVSPAAEAIVTRALAKDPRDRYPSGAAMAEDLEAALAGRRPPHTSPEGAAAAPRRGAGRVEAEGTVVARTLGLSAEHGLPELALDDAHPSLERPSSPRRRRPSPLRAASLTLLLGGLAFFYSAISGPERLAEALAPFLAAPGQVRETGAKPGAVVPSRLPPSPEPSPTPGDPGLTPASEPPPSPPPSEEAAARLEPEGTGPTAAANRVPPADGTASADASAAPAGEPAGEPEADEEAPVLLPDDGAEAAPPAAGATEPLTVVSESPAAAVESPTSPGKPPPTPAPASAASAFSRSPASPRAELAIHLEHPLTQGTVRVWLDDKLVLRAPLSSVVSKKILFFAFKSGRVRESLEVLPGKRRLRVEVRGKDRSDSAQTTAEFKPGARRRLYARPGESRGRLALEWR